MHACVRECMCACVRVCVHACLHVCLCLCTGVCDCVYNCVKTVKVKFLNGPKNARDVEHEVTVTRVGLHQLGKPLYHIVSDEPISA